MKHGIVLFGHGSRDPAWRAPMDAVAAAIRQRDPAVQVACAFLEFTEPGLPAAVQQLAAAGAHAVRVVPMFLGVGTHARSDLPKLVTQARAACPGVRLEVDPAVGERPELVDFLAGMALGKRP